MDKRTKIIGRKITALLLAVMMCLSLLPMGAMAAYTTYKSTITLYPGGASPTGTNMSVGDCINGHWYVTSISTSGVTFGSPYGEHNNSFNIPDPGTIWKGVTYDYNTYVSGSAFFNQPKVGSSGHIIYTAGKAYYYNMKAVTGGTTNPGTTTSPGTGGGGNTSPSSDVWNFTLYYNGNGGSQFATQYWSGSKYTKSGQITIHPNVPVRSGYKFIGWKSGNGTSYECGDTYNIYSDVFPGGYNGGSSSDTLTAQWAREKKLTLIYNANGGNDGPENEIYETDDSVKSYDFAVSYVEPTREGYTFLGWSTSSGATTPSYYGGDTINVTGTTTLHAVWQKQSNVTLTYDANNGTSTTVSEEYAKDYSVTLKNANTLKFTRSGYTFLGWNTDKNATTADWGAGEEMRLNTDVTLYAVWKANEKVTLTYDASGGVNAPKAVTVTKGRIVTVAGVGNMTKSGYTFLGWSTARSASAVTVNVNSLLTLNTNLTLYAVWKANTPVTTTYNYTLTYDANGGKLDALPNDPTTTSVNATNTTGKRRFGLKQEKDLKPTRSNYIFTGWSTDKEATYPETELINKGYIILTSEKPNVTLYAVWKENKSNVTLTYNANGGILNFTPDSYSDKKGADGKAYFILKDGPTRENDAKGFEYLFKGWNRDPNAAGVWSAGYNLGLEYDMTLYAIWGRRYKLMADANGGHDAEGKKDIVYTTASETTNKTSKLQLAYDGERKLKWDGHVFLGWADDENVTEVQYKYNDSIPLTYDEPEKTIYAVWRSIDTNNKYTVTYTDGVNGKAFEDDVHSNITEGEATPEYRDGAVPTREGYEFDKWSPELYDTVTKDITYKAIWKEKRVWDPLNHEVKLTFVDGLDEKTAVEAKDYASMKGFSEVILRKNNALYKSQYPDAPFHSGSKFVGWDAPVQDPADENHFFVIANYTEGEAKYEVRYHWDRYGDADRYKGGPYTGSLTLPATQIVNENDEVTVTQLDKTKIYTGYGNNPDAVWTVEDDDLVVQENPWQWKFVGWSEEERFYQASSCKDNMMPDKFIMPGHDVDLYAKWELISGQSSEIGTSINVSGIPVKWLDGYTDGDKGVLKRDTILGMLSGNPIIPLPYPTDPQRDGYEFTGWGNPVKTTENKSTVYTITAQWAVKVPVKVRMRFEGLTAADWDNIKAYLNGAETNPKNSTGGYYQVNSCEKGTEADGTPYIEFAKAHGYQEWEVELGKEYTVKYLETNPNVKGYHWGGIKNDSGEYVTTLDSGGKAPYTTKITFTEADVVSGRTITITNKYYHNVKWVDGNGTELKSDTFTDYEKIPKYGDNPTKQDDDNYTYEFKEWVRTDDNETGDVTFTASYTATPKQPTPTEFTVTYTDGVNNEEVFKDQTTKAAEGDLTPEFVGGEPERKGYTFNGWDPEVAETVTGDVTYTAQWIKNAVTYTLTYDAKGGENAPSDQTETNSDDKATFTVSETEPTKDGFVFKGWSKNEAASTVDYAPGASIDVTAVLTTLYAVWDENTVVEPEDVTLTYMNGEEQYGDREIYAQGAEVTVIVCDAEKDGYVFKGWDTAEEAKTVVYEKDAKFAINADLTLYAVWSKTHKIKWVYPDGEPIGEERIVEEGEDVPETEYPEPVIPDGYDIDGWDEGEPDPDTGDVVITLKLKAKDTTYTVEWYDRDNDSKPMSTATRDAKVGETVSVTDDDKFVRDYTFDEDNENNVLSKEVLPDGGTVLKLYFISDNYSITIQWLDNSDNTEIKDSETRAVKLGVPGATAYITENDKNVDGYIYNDEVSDKEPHEEDGVNIIKLFFDRQNDTEHKVTWYDEDGETLLDIGSFKDGEDEPEYSKGTPTKESDRTYNYTFKEWIREVKENGDVVYTASYSSKRKGGGGSSRPSEGITTPKDDKTDNTVIINDDDTPLANLPELNDTDHFAYIIGYDDGTVRPEANISRAEVATIFFRLMTDESRQENFATVNSFDDVDEANWFNNAVSTTAKSGIVKGDVEGGFRPEDAITRAEFAAIAARFLSEGAADEGTFSDISGHWAENEILRAVKAGWIKGYEDGTFRPDTLITRAEAVTLINRMLNRETTKEHMLGEMTVWSDNAEGEWYYEAIQEATNSHNYNKGDDGEVWNSMRETRDWAALEK